jgi:hypothetical protein
VRVGEPCSDGVCGCVADCAGKVCGADGCGGSCGTCGVDKVCTNAGACVTTPVCGNGSCQPGETEQSCPADCVAPKCALNQCGGKGTDGCYCDEICATNGNCCANVCDMCPALKACKASCEPKCAGKTCGSDGCGGSCGTCAGDQTCNGNGTCGACVPDCSDRICGNDGCGGSCGKCANQNVCATGACYAKVDCNDFCTARCTDAVTCALSCIFAGPNGTGLTQKQLDCLEFTNPCNFTACITFFP